MTNDFHIIGNLTANPILSTVKDEKCCYFTVAVNRLGEDKADFIPCKAKGITAENLVKYKKKGDEIAVSGPFLSWNKEGEEINGRPVDRWLLAAYNIHYCRGEGRRNEQQAEPPATPPAGQADQSAGGFRRRR